MFDTIDGLPVHVLVVHVAVVLIPLAAIGAILIALRPRAMRLFGVATVLGAAIGTVASFVARSSGESLSSRIGFPEPHVNYGETFPIAALGFLILLVIFWLFARGVPLNRNRPLWLKVFGGAVVVAAIGISYFTFLVGHTGAEATWATVIENSKPGTYSESD
jgi:uncharacterized membrane protein